MFWMTVNNSHYNQAIILESEFDEQGKSMLQERLELPISDL